MCCKKHPFFTAHYFFDCRLFYNNVFYAVAQDQVDEFVA